MQYTTLILTALSVGSAFAQYGNGDSGTSTSAASSSTSSGSVTVHVVHVGGANGSLTYSPNNVQAAVGDMVQFQYGPANHTVTQSTFDQPCQPISLNSNVTGIFSGFQPVSATDTTIPTFTIQINNTTPVWIYCSQAEHCQKGMVLVINENTAANATRSLDNFIALAAKATANLAPSTISNGTEGSTSSSSAGTGTSSGSGSTSSGTTTSSGSSSAGSVIKASDAFGMAGLLGLAVAFLL